MTGALAGLHVFERYVIGLLAVRKGMPDIAQHLHAAWPDVDLMGIAADGAHQAMSLLERTGAGGKARHRVRQDVGARQPQLVHGLSAHYQRLRGIQAARNSDHHALDAGRLQALHQALHLDLVNLAATLIPVRRFRRNIREALVNSLRNEAPMARRTHRAANGPKILQPPALAEYVLAEASHAHAFLGQPLQVDLGSNQLRLAAESRGLGQNVAVLADDAVPV